MVISTLIWGFLYFLSIGLVTQIEALVIKSHDP